MYVMRGNCHEKCADFHRQNVQTLETDYILCLAGRYIIDSIDDVMSSNLLAEISKKSFLNHMSPEKKVHEHKEKISVSINPGKEVTVGGL